MPLLERLPVGESSPIMGTMLIGRDVMGEGNSVTIRIQMDAELRARFKAACALEQATMNDIVVGLIEGWTDGKPAPKAKVKTAKPKG